MKQVSLLPKTDWPHHQRHCCVEHGCKYNTAGCPVVLELAPQEDPCPECKIEEQTCACSSSTPKTIILPSLEDISKMTNPEHAESVAIAHTILTQTIAAQINIKTINLKEGL